MRLSGCLLLATSLVFFLQAHPAQAQDLPLTQKLTMSTLEPLDPSRTVVKPVLERDIHKPLPEEYIWTATPKTGNAKLLYASHGIAEQTEPHYFRTHFRIDRVPPAATLYTAGPRSVSIWVNGQLADRISSDTGSPLGMHVFTTPVAKFLHVGDNVVAIQAVRGRGVSGYANSALVRQQTFGQVLVAKIVPSAPGVKGTDILHSNAAWKSSATGASGWEQSSFHDADWPAVMTLGGIESNIELLQWNADAGLYNWPGYDGISDFLAHMPMNGKVLASYSGRGHFESLESLSSGAGELRLSLPEAQVSDSNAPSLFIDFGREITGRLEIVSATEAPLRITVQMGESESETLKSPYLGVNELTIPPNGIGHSSKTAFRYAKLRFLGGAREMHFASVRADHVYYPVQFAGSFESSDPVLNRVWETGAYTAHLCMQDGVWDASKRDRGRWMGDTDVSGPVIEEAFGERTLLEDTLDRLLGPDPNIPVDQHVNGIPGYSSFWFTGVADFYRHSGDKAFLEREHKRMLELLNVVDGEFDEHGIYANKSKVWLYVDWSPDLNGDTPETRRATTLEFLRAYREASYLLSELGDTASAAKYEKRAEATQAAANQYLLDASSGTFGPRWQTNAAAVLSGAAGADRYDAIWHNVLSQVGHAAPAGMQHNIITPYYGAYVLRAMARMGHRQDALAWIRQNWGGMLQEGATSFWEAYDPNWYQEDFHASLQADNRSGYFVSLAHGWSAGPTAWLTEEVLGIQPTAAGYGTVNLRPDLIDLDWARGAVPTPHGLLKLEARKNGAATSITVDLPEGVVAQLSVPFPVPVRINDAVQAATLAENGTRSVVTFSHAGHYVITQ